MPTRLPLRSLIELIGRILGGDHGHTSVARAGDDNNWFARGGAQCGGRDAEHAEIDRFCNDRVFPVGGDSRTLLGISDGRRSNDCRPSADDQIATANHEQAPVLF